MASIVTQVYSHTRTNCILTHSLCEGKKRIEEESTKKNGNCKKNIWYRKIKFLPNMRKRSTKKSFIYIFAPFSLSSLCSSSFSPFLLQWPTPIQFHIFARMAVMTMLTRREDINFSVLVKKNSHWRLYFIPFFKEEKSSREFMMLADFKFPQALSGDRRRRKFIHHYYYYLLCVETFIKSPVTLWLWNFFLCARLRDSESLSRVDKRKRKHTKIESLHNWIQLI